MTEQTSPTYTENDLIAARLDGIAQGQNIAYAKGSRDAWQRVRDGLIEMGTEHQDICRDCAATALEFFNLKGFPNKFTVKVEIPDGSTVIVRNVEAEDDYEAIEKVTNGFSVECVTVDWVYKGPGDTAADDCIGSFETDVEVWDALVYTAEEEG